MNLIAATVVAGNIRRSATICIGDPDDIEYLRAKRWDLGNIPNWRCMSNNSVACSDIAQLPEEFWEGYKGNGEPYGLINLELARKIGRLADGDKYPDPDIVGVNPCSEQVMNNFETCCLSEIFLPNVRSLDEMKDVASLLYRICKNSLRLKCHHHETETVVHKNMRMGIGISGYCQSTEEQKSWLSPTYEYLRALDEEYSAKQGFPTSIKLTTVKPSGTLSLLPSVTPGWHPGLFKYYIRRVRIASDSSLVDLCKKHGCPVEYQVNFDGSLDYNTSVVEFPCMHPEGTVLAKDLTAIDELEIIQQLQTVWSDNAISATVYYRLEELPAIKKWLTENYSTSTKAVSFLLHSEHGFKQAPYEEINEEEYHKRVAAYTPITSYSMEEQEDDVEFEQCPGGACPIK